MKIAVVGAGIVGASTAYHLARKGVDVVLFDRAHQGQATAAGAGIVCPWISRRGADWYRMAGAGARYYSTLVSWLREDGEQDFGFARVGALAVSSDNDELDDIEKQALECKASAPEIGEISRLTPEEAGKLFPPLRKDLAAVHITGAARVDGRLLRDALQRAAQKYGADYREGEAELAIDSGQITGVRVNNELVTADAVVVAAGAWASALLRPLGLELAVEPQRGQIVHLQLPGTDTSQWPVILPQSSHYLLAFADSRVVVGATRETGSGFDYRVTVAGMSEVLGEALSVAPGLANSTLHETRIGFRPFTRDNLPLLGAIPNVPGLVVATGLGPSGLTMGPYVGRLAAALSIGEQPEMNLAAYDPQRETIRS